MPGNEVGNGEKLINGLGYTYLVVGNKTFFLTEK